MAGSPEEDMLLVTRMTQVTTWHRKVINNFIHADNVYMKDCIQVMHSSQLTCELYTTFKFTYMYLLKLSAASRLYPYSCFF